MFEVVVEDIFTITGRGTIFAGKVVSGSISVGDPVLIKTKLKEINTRVASLEEIGSGRMLETAEAGSSVGVLCLRLKQSTFDHTFEPDGDVMRVVGVTLVPGKKKRWWQF